MTPSRLEPCERVEVDELVVEGDDVDARGEGSQVGLIEARPEDDAVSEGHRGVVQ